MNRFSNVEIPFCKNEVYHSLSMPSRCILFAMYHLWLAGDKRNVVFNEHFRTVMAGVISEQTFDYFALNRNTVRKLNRLGLVANKHGYTFVSEVYVTERYSTGIVAEIQQDSKQCKKASKRSKNASKWNKSGSKWSGNASNRCKNEPNQTHNPVDDSIIIDVITPKHENFTD